MKKTIGFIGAGNMTTAIIKGLIENFPDASNQIYVSDVISEKAHSLCRTFNVNMQQKNTDLVNASNIIVLAIKPNVYNSVINEIKDSLVKDTIIISLGAGITIDSIECLSNIPLKIIRMMPNMPISIGQGMIAVSANNNITNEELEIVLDMFSSMGKVDVINENLMNMIPAVSGSSPAFVYMFIESLADGAVLQGMGREKAYKYAAQAVLGAAKMVLEAHKHPGELKDMVCSPAGTTIEAVYSLEKSGFRGSIIEAMNICTAKTQKMSTL